MHAIASYTNLEEGDGLAGNILYIPFTFLMAIGLILLVAVLAYKKGKRAAAVALLPSIPILILFQFYFWNAEFHHYVKSYAFPSRTFTCKYEEEWHGLSVPLSERTVLLGSEDVCSPFYLTYAEVNKFESLYRRELERLKDEGKIRAYENAERANAYGSKYMEYTAELSSGSKIHIAYKREASTNLITINYES
ncbi:hypothetical protein [Cohnella thailandensis]|uniref:Uncharacterized protein n=1 Tax=Cohnella thailandensis TaxID=557557 RepID=A0A841T9U1_9BACL|nr:hypothetical protein [Cohnella thailandensis]MBB6637981.1 hypothetical protein [Cohnella thailandensis]MBP1976880.1 energy-coupling factor transporter transmembrane protein EcfT [Cohnella thailandensis]